MIVKAALMIEVQSLSKWYGDKQATSQLSFSIQSGEIVGLLGLNGAGKSTILKTLATLLLPTEGEAKIAGFSVRTEAHEVRRIIGYLPDTPPVYEEMSVESFLRFVAKLKGVARENVKSKIDLAVQKTDLGQVLTKRMGELSHGYRQRTNIAQALIHEPKVLILDEPINGLDPIQIVEMRDLILSLKSQHTVLLSSHILSEITKTCDRILVIDQGKLVAEGSEEELKQKADDRFVIELHFVPRSERDTQKLLEAIRSNSEVLDVSVAGDRLCLESKHDLRAELIRKLVASGHDVLGLRKKEAELETLFLKLVGGSKRDE